MNPKYKPIVKWLIGMSLYAAAIWGSLLFSDYRVCVFTVMTLGAVGFGMALWTLCRNKTVVSIVLASALALQPMRAGESQPDLIAALIVGGICLAVGGVIVWGLLKITKKLPDPSKHKNPPPATNGEPVAIAMVLNQSLSGAPPLIMPEAPITEMNDWDNVPIQFQSSTNGVDWQEEYTATNWFNNTQMVSILYSNGVALMTNFANMFWTNENVTSDFSPVMPSKMDAPLKLWRAVQLQ